MDRKKLFRTAFLFIFLVALVGFACAIPGLPGEGQPTGEPGEPTTLPEKPTVPPEVEPTAPPAVNPTSPGAEIIPPDNGGSDTSDTLQVVKS